MAYEVKYDTSHHAGGTPEARIASRLRNSGDAENADHVVQKGEGPTRAFHNIFHAGHKVQEGTAAKPTDGRVTKLESSKVGGVGHND
jgi:hypothetical protein